ncbi:MAG: hypothetical protein E6R13_07855 [Spirochaetes bacterium]|nr:MAG: hypothetical protein E6R13_07855 [Spirochaetota bacterium]
MSRINSKKKGNSYELRVSKILSESLSPLTFKRVPHSGAYLGGSNSERSADFNEDSATSLVGDIYCSNGKIKFIIESKFYKEAVKFTDLFNDNCQIFKWFNEAKFDCNKFKNKKPLLIFKYNRTDDYVCIDYDLIKDKIPDNQMIIVKGLSILKLEIFLTLGKIDWILHE